MVLLNVCVLFCSNYAMVGLKTKLKYEGFQ